VFVLLTSMDKMTTVRRCTSNDLAAAKSLIAELYRDRPQDADLDELPTRLSEFSLVAELEGEIIGLVIAVRRSTLEPGNEISRDAFPDEDEYLEVQDLFVRQANRGSGTGSALIKEVLAVAKSAGVCRSMVYSANADYIRIARFYENCGFRMWHIFMTQ
jgi:GNAT superfamily N-acetyltransferase